MVDTGGEGDLTAASPMAPFRHERQLGELGFGTELTYCVQAGGGARVRARVRVGAGVRVGVRVRGRADHARVAVRGV